MPYPHRKKLHYLVSTVFIVLLNTNFKPHNECHQNEMSTQHYLANALQIEHKFTVLQLRSLTK